MSNPQSEPKSVGILGGGQLGCMLMDAALAMGLSPKIFTERASPAAALFQDNAVLGSMNDENQLRAFFSKVSLVAFENEFLDCDLLERASAGIEIEFAPRIGVIRELQDKLKQKILFQKLGLPTAPFVEILCGNADGSEAAMVDTAFARFPSGVVFKWSRMGYDGKGVLLAKSTFDGRSEAVSFCSDSLKRGVPVYAEQKIAFRSELAIVANRSLNGDFATFPLVISEQKNGICRRVFGPATRLGISSDLEIKAQAHAKKIADAVELVGAFALELFVTPDGALWINEIAPRVHNSAHYTQDACATSQFESHWRAILGMRQGDLTPRLTQGIFGMLNLLGPEAYDAIVPRRRDRLPFPNPGDPLHLHWYAKEEIRPRRKVGHVNGVMSDPNDLPELQQRLEQYHSTWVSHLQKIIPETAERKTSP